ncbi:ATP-binding protein [Cryobacterium sp. TMS1-20-1]|uniref:sensor histidine kinase n=1 Tax=Cryobacterium sp. TMS1-20-1 TaxID=1259223 RepID=UPI00106A811E|nr:ATP-binding protein [Cryobacterium sp. TMS1-20-1]TFC76710.1 ATP-binding protein [Cryobacterium sp. TMS1-20-1]
MSLGLPGHLVQRTLARAIARAAHWFALTCFSAAILSVSILSLSTPELWITIVVVAAMAAPLILFTRHRRIPLAVAYLLVGTLGVYVFTATVLGVPDVFPASNMFLVALPKMALVMVGGAGSTALAGVLWSTAAFLLAEAAALLAIVGATVPYQPYQPDLFTLSTYLVLVGVMVLAGIDRRASNAAQPAIHRAVQDGANRQLRDALDTRAIALLNDTTVSQLVALSLAEPGALSPGLKASLRDTLTTLHDTNWLADIDARTTTSPQPTVHEQAPTPSPAWRSSAVYTAVERCRDRGLKVEVTGDRDALARLDAGSDRDVGLAVQQCLVNVILHAGIDSAELAIESDRTTISLLITDAGRGFTESESASDRLGLRQSVRRRIEQLGGSVLIWSRPGAGASVRLTVPAETPSIKPKPTLPTHHTPVRPGSLNANPANGNATPAPRNPR